MFIVLRGFFSRAAYNLIMKISIKWVLLFVLGHFLTSWALISYFEPGSEYARLDTYWWFYIVTVTTVGYGDFSPSLFGTRFITAFYVMPVGIAVAGAVIGKIAALVAETSTKMERGLMHLHLKDHTVVVGDGSPHTIALLKNLIADPTVGQVVLLSERESNPLNGNLDGFVSGDVADEVIQKRACLSTAKRVIVLGDSDIVVSGRTIAVMDCVSATAEIIAYFQHEETSNRMNRQTDARVRTVTSVSMDLVVQEALDPGASGFVKELLRNGEGGTYMRMEVPEGVETTWLGLCVLLMEHDLNPMSLYVAPDDPDVIPKGSTPVHAGDIIAVAAENRAQLEKIDWSRLQSKAA